MSEEQKNKPPIFKQHIGCIDVSMWENQSEKGSFFTVTCSRSYKNSKDEWAKSNSYRVNDLPVLILALEECFKHAKTSIKENESESDKK